MPSLQIPPLPADTARAAELAFGRDHLCLRVGRELENLLSNFELPSLSCDNNSAFSGFWPYSLASILQFWEDLTDRQMNSAARTRLDLRYALHLSLDFPGFEPHALCSFRSCLLADPSGKKAFQDMLDRMRALSVDPTKQRSEADQIISDLCLLSRAETIIEAMGNALEALASEEPDWLITCARPYWYARYALKTGPHQIPRDYARLVQFLQAVGEDGQYLLHALQESDRPGLVNLPEVLALGNEWQRQYRQQGQSLQLYPVECATCARQLTAAPAIIRDQFHLRGGDTAQANHTH